MPRVPTVGLSPTSRPQFQAPGVVAYGGRPIEMQESMQRGARMERIGRVVSQIGLEIEDKVNNARAQEATNVFENGVNKAFLEFQQKKGQDGVNGLAEFQQQVQELRDSAGSMLMNDMQRAAATPIFDKVGSRAELRGQSHYMEQAAAYEQTQNIMAQAVLQDSMIANPGAESLVDFGRWGNLVMKEGEARGLEGKTLQAWAMGKRDKLFEAIVTASLDSEDPSKIAAVEGLLSQLPEGFLSQTQSQALSDLVQKKSAQFNAFAWASQAFQSKKTYQEAYQEIDELAATDPRTAKARSEALDSRYNAGRKAELEARADLRQRLEDKIYNRDPLTSEEIQQARRQGIAFDLEKFQNNVETERDQTTPSGKSVYASLLNNIPALMDIGNGAQVFAYARSKGMSYADATYLAGQRNRYDEDASTGRRSSGKSKSSRVDFDVFDTDEDQVVETALFHLDGKNAKDKSLVPYRRRVSSPYGGNQTEANYALRMMVNKFKIDVMDVANSILAQVPDNETVNRNEILQQAAKVVYERGWSNEDHTVNRYTTEYAYLPDVPDDVRALMPQAREDLRKQQRNEAVQRALAGDPAMIRSGGMMIQQQFLEQAAAANIFDPTMARALSGAMRQASSVEATSTISEADVQARAQVMLKQDKESQRLQSEEERQAAHRDIARVLLDLKVSEIKSTYTSTDIFGREVERGYGQNEPANARQRMRNFLALSSVRALRDQWANTALDEDWEEEFKAFALQFYPGPKRDEKFFPAQTKVLLKNLPRSSDAPGETLSRFDALKQRYSIN